MEYATLNLEIETGIPDWIKDNLKGYRELERNGIVTSLSIVCDGHGKPIRVDLSYIPMSISK